MRKVLVTAATVLWASSSLAQDGPPAPTGYLTPPQVIVDILDAPPTPAAVVSPVGDFVAFTQQRSMPSVSELAQPMHRLAGLRINPRNNAPWRTPAIDRITLTRLEDSTTHEIFAPLGTTLAWVRFSPDGAYLSYAVVRDTGVELWVVETASGTPRPLTSASLNATWGNPCDWLADSSGVLCTFLMSARGAPPAQPAEPAGPNIQESQGRFAPVRTYQDLLGHATRRGTLRVPLHESDRHGAGSHRKSQQHQPPGTVRSGLRSAGRRARPGHPTQAAVFQAGAGPSISTIGRALEQRRRPRSRAGRFCP